MKPITLIILFLFGLKAHASFSYEKVVPKLGLNVLSVGRPWTFTGVHRFYTDPSFTRAMLVMENIPGTKRQLEITAYKSYTLIEYPVGEASYNSVALVNISKDEIQSFLYPSSVKGQNHLKKFMQLFIPEAHASTQCETGAILSQDSGLSEMMNYLSTGYFQVASSCLMGVLEGVWESTGGLVESSWKGLSDLASDPRKFWDDKVEQFKRLKTFLMDFEVNMQKMFASFKNLPDESKAQMLCSFVGSIGTDVLIAVFTAGAGAAKIAASIKTYVNKLIKIESLLNKLTKMGRMSELPATFFEKLSKGLISEKRLTSIQSLSKHDFDDLAMQLVRCSL